MGTPIVDPMWFYWISVVDNIKFVLSALAFIIGGILIAAIIVMAANCDDEDDFDDFRQAFKKFKGLRIVTFTVCLILMICFVPSSETLIKMEIAKHATYENTTIAIEKIEEVAKDIIHELQGDD